MTILEILMLFAFINCLIALAMTAANLRMYKLPPDDSLDTQSNNPLVTVCVPARNEEANIEDCVRSLLASDLKSIEVIVYDDESTDQTGAILNRITAEDSRLRLAQTQPLPDGWNGKQHGCYRCAEQANGEWLLFTDADVRFESGAVRRAVLHAKHTDSDLVSTFPRQITGTLPETLAVPMIFFMLFSYLPFKIMRDKQDNANACAGCGQFLLARAEAYHKTGGHSAFKDTMHDGIKMPRRFRAVGFRTDLFDGTDLCRVRMYNGLGETWRGFTKNAFEGLGSVGLLVFLTVIHLSSHVLPWIVLPALIVLGLTDGLALPLALGAVAASFTQRALLAERFKLKQLSVVLHPIGALTLVAIQWHSLLIAKAGKRSWRGRPAVEGIP
ncbi:MAG: glycosyltransferase family 2 protein [Planctomycetota bacterium]